MDQIQLPRRPARRFLGDIASLAASMQEYGLQQPISVRTDGDKYVLTSGLRRYSAAQMLGWKTISAFVRSVTADEAYLVDLVENLQREDLSPEEEADALGELVRTRGWTLEQVAEAVKRSPGYVSKRVRLFEDPELRDAVVNHGLPVSSAELLLAAPSERKDALIGRAVAEHWDQMRVRDELQAMSSRSVQPKDPPADDADTPPSGTVQRATQATTFSAERPRGLTRMIREFYRTIMAIRAQDLTAADRAALRSVFKALAMLARTPTTPREPVFPPLPAVRGSGPRRSRTPKRTTAPRPAASKKP